jgi:hypothetical protein
LDEWLGEVESSHGVDVDTCLLVGTLHADDDIGLCGDIGHEELLHHDEL